ncbi:hypothetical protein H2203_008662 [Taxawa tesnikishii (nom. ined.)]|nr:hypothetical protein H2203_008662 [Dothideales sp. JES 119]
MITAKGVTIPPIAIPPLPPPLAPYGYGARSFNPYRNRDVSHRNLHLRDHPYRSNRDSRSNASVRCQNVLIDEGLEHNGNLAWTLDYATAFAVQYVSANKHEVVDAIDAAWDRAVLCNNPEELPYVVFDIFDKSMFAGKLKDMVYLEWIDSSSRAYGKTSAPGVEKKRIAIQLNHSVIRQHPEPNACAAHIMAALIHQMVHAYFLVCCGPQPNDAKSDGRLLDGKHFGIVLRRIKELTDESANGVLPLRFYSVPSFERDHPGLAAETLFPFGPRRSPRRDIFAPKGSDAIPSRNDVTHCAHDNSYISLVSCQSFLESTYASALALDLESTLGLTVQKLDDSGLSPFNRLTEAPPSAEYMELVWDGQRIMVSKEKVSKLSSFKKQIGKGERDIKVPKCSLDILKCLHSFIIDGRYAPDIESLRDASSSAPNPAGSGPGPILSETKPEWPAYLLTDISAYTVASSMDFPELATYALNRLHDLPFTHNDPIAAFKEIYSSSGGAPEPLRRWTRKLLTRVSGDGKEAKPNLYRLADGEWNAAYTEFYYRNAAFKEDVDQAWAIINARPDCTVIAPAAPKKKEKAKKKNEGEKVIYEYCSPDGYRYATPVAVVERGRIRYVAPGPKDHLLVAEHRSSPPTPPVEMLRVRPASPTSSSASSRASKGEKDPTPTPFENGWGPFRLNPRTGRLECFNHRTGKTAVGRPTPLPGEDSDVFDEEKEKEDEEEEEERRVFLMERPAPRDQRRLPPPAYYHDESDGWFAPRGTRVRERMRDGDFERDLDYTWWP